MKEAYSNWWIYTVFVLAIVALVAITPFLSKHGVLAPNGRIYRAAASAIRQQADAPCQVEGFNDATLIRRGLHAECLINCDVLTSDGVMDRRLYTVKLRKVDGRWHAYDCRYPALPYIPRPDEVAKALSRGR